MPTKRVHLALFRLSLQLLLGPHCPSKAYRSSLIGPGISLGGLLEAVWREEEG
jgi:hypothetical protein